MSDLENRYAGKGYGAFKADLAEAVNGVLRPVRDRYAELRADPGAVADDLRKGAEAARAVAGTTMEAVRRRTGLLL